KRSPPCDRLSHSGMRQAREGRKSTASRPFWRDRLAVGLPVASRRAVLAATLWIWDIEIRELFRAALLVHFNGRLHGGEASDGRIGRSAAHDEEDDGHGDRC